MKNLVNFEKFNVMTGGDTSLFLEMSKMFMDSYDEMLEALEKSVKDEDYAEIYKAAHKLKGSAASLACDELAEVCLKIERTTKQENITSIFPLLIQVRNFKSEFAFFLKNQNHDPLD